MLVASGAGCGKSWNSSLSMVSFQLKICGMTAVCYVYYMSHCIMQTDIWSRTRHLLSQPKPANISKFCCLLAAYKTVLPKQHPLGKVFSTNTAKIHRRCVSNMWSTTNQQRRIVDNNTVNYIIAMLEPHSCLGNSYTALIYRCNTWHFIWCDTLASRNICIRLNFCLYVFRYLHRWKNAERSYPY